MGRFRRMLASILAAALLAAPASAFAQPPAPAAPAITPARIAEVMARARQHGTCVLMTPAANADVGLTRPGEPYLARQVSFAFGGRDHYWSVHVEPRDVAHVFTIEGRSLDIWVFDLRGTLTSAASIRDGALIMVPLQQARAGFDVEMRNWSRIRLPAPETPPTPCNLNTALRP